MKSVTLTYASCSLEIVTLERGRLTTETFSPVACKHDSQYPDLVEITARTGKVYTVDHKFVDEGTYATPTALFDFINTSVKACLAG